MSPTFNPDPSSRIEIRGQRGNFNWLDGSQKQFILNMQLPAGAPVPYIEAVWPADDEPRWDDQPPSEVADLIASRIRHYFSTSQDSYRLGIVWVRENAEEIDRLWARQEVAKRSQWIDKLQKEIAALQRDYIDADEEEDEEVAA